VGVNPTSQQQSRQDNIVGRLLAAHVLNKLCTQQTLDDKAYTVSEYLDDLQAEVWKPLDGLTPWKAQLRRSLQRSWLATLGRLMNPDEKTTASSRVDQGDAALYLVQHLDKIEQFLTAQKGGKDLNALHYEDLLRQVKLIKERRVTVK